MQRGLDVDVDVDVDCETLRSACGIKGASGVRTSEPEPVVVGTTNARTPVAARQGGYVSRRATLTGASVAARATCELVRAYKDAKLACGGVGKGGV